MEYRTWLTTAMCGCLTLVCAEVSLATDSFPYATTRDQLVRVGDASGSQVRITAADGTENLCPKTALNQISSPADATDKANGDLERAFETVQSASQSLRAQLAKEFDDGYLEMMAVVLSSTDNHPGGRSDLQSIVLESRERRLHALVDQCKGFDVNLFIRVLGQCDFVAAFLEAAAVRAESQCAAFGREKTWVDARAQVETGAEQQSLRKRAADLAREMQNTTEMARTLREKQATGVRIRQAATSLQNEYFQTYEKATQFLKVYAAVRDRTIRGNDLVEMRELALATASDWARNMLKPETREAAGKANTALALLDRRRNPPKPKPSAAQPPPAEKKTEPQKKNDGCFVATAVYGSYDHPNVLTLRAFRDRVLAKCAAGRRFIGWYYREGPIVADWLNTHSGCKPLVVAPLSALVWAIRNPILLAVSCVVFLALARWWCNRRLGSVGSKEVSHESAI